MRRSFITLVIIGIVLNAAVLLAASSEVNHVRSDFCAWTAQHYQADLTQLQTAARRADEKSDRQLERKLGCG
jgi:hypothetical protein